MKKLIMGTLLLALSASPALAKYTGPGGPGGPGAPANVTNDVSVGISKTNVTVGDTTGTITIQGRYASNFGSNNIGATVAPQTVLFPHFDAPYFTGFPADAKGSLTYTGSSVANTAIGAYTQLEQPRLTISEDGLTDIIQSLIDAGGPDLDNDYYRAPVQNRASVAGVIVTVGAIHSSPDIWEK